MDQNQKCSIKSHKDLVVIKYCEQCKIFMCNKCLNHHKELFENHQLINLDKNNNEIFIDLCKKIGHEKKFEFFCKTHNELCCIGCITKIQEKGYGQHKDCDICIIENIKEEKKSKLNENMKSLKELTNDLEKNIDKLKLILEIVNKTKEELKLNVQKIFTKIRTVINEREDELLSDIDNEFSNNFCGDDIIEESIKLPNKIKQYLEKENLLNNDWNNIDKLSSLINDCNNIEMNIKNINSLKEKIKKCEKFNDYKIMFTPKDESIDIFIDSIKKFGEIIVLPLYFDDSIILKNKEESIKLIKLLSTQLKISNMKLLYRATRDGLEFKNVSDKINNKSNLIFLYLTGNERIFGNYVKVNLENLGDKKDKYYKDENAFVFCLNNNKIYKILNPDLSIRFYIQTYPILVGNSAKGNGFYFSGNTIHDTGLLNNPKIYDFEKNQELTEVKK